MTTPYRPSPHPLKAPDHVRGLRATPQIKAGPRAGRQVAKLIRDVMPPGPGLASLQFHWASIVGAEIARHTAPARLSGRGRTRTLTLDCRGAASVLIQSQSALILSRVNQFAGRAVAQRIALQHWAAPPAPPAANASPPPPLAEEMRAQLTRSVCHIDDAKLRDALWQFGEKLYRRHQQRR